MIYENEKINFTNYSKALERETDLEKTYYFATLIKIALIKANIKGKINVEFFKDSAKVEVNNKYYNMFSYKNKTFFDGFVGD